VIKILTNKILRRYAVMVVLKLVSNKINFGRLIFAFVLLVTLQNEIYINTIAQNAITTDTKSSLIITASPVTLNLRFGAFTVNPSEIFKGESVKFKLDKIVFENGSIASNLPCRLTITSPDGNLVVLDGQTNSTGECLYDTSLSLAAQGFTLVSGDILKITSTIGQGTAFATVTYNRNPYISSVVTYVVKPKTVVIGNFTINPDTIDINGNLIYRLDPVKYIDGTIFSNAPVTLNLIAPNGNTIVVSGIADSAGSLVFDISKSLPSQGITLVSGNITDLNNQAGNGSGSAKIIYDGVTYTSNINRYVVKSPVIVIPPIIPIKYIPPIVIPVVDVPKLITILVRTGGGVPLGIVTILFLSFVVFMVRSSLKKRKK
jgi:hypothetical protein